MVIFGRLRPRRFARLISDSAQPKSEEEPIEGGKEKLPIKEHDHYRTSENHSQEIRDIDDQRKAAALQTHSNSNPFSPENNYAVSGELSSALPQPSAHASSQPIILPRNQHPISRGMIDDDALKVMYRLRQQGYKAYLVGGAVRDLLLARAPKDFDVGTDARTEKIRGIFRNSRVIGRRFRINHVYFAGNKIIEVSTFRALTLSDPENENVLLRYDNTYGTPESDARRRDLTINGLFYDIETFSVIDYVGGLDDLRAKVIRIIGDPEVRIQEDPIRMIRAIRHAARIGFTIEENTYKAICRLKSLIQLCPKARLYEEFVRELKSGNSRESFRLLFATGLLEYLLPVLAESLDVHYEEVWPRLERVLARVDQGMLSGKEFNTSIILAAIFEGNFPEKLLKNGVDTTVSQVFRKYLSHVPEDDGAEDSPSTLLGEVEGGQLNNEEMVHLSLSPACQEGDAQDLEYELEPQLQAVIGELCKSVGVFRREREHLCEILIERSRLFSQWHHCARSHRSNTNKRPPKLTALLRDTIELLQLTAEEDTQSWECLRYWEDRLSLKGHGEAQSSRKRKYPRRRKRN